MREGLLKLGNCKAKVRCILQNKILSDFSWHLFILNLVLLKTWMLKYVAKRQQKRKEATLFILVLTVICLFNTKVPAAGSTEFQFGFEMEIQLLCAWKEVHRLCNSQFLFLEHWLNSGKQVEPLIYVPKWIEIWSMNC